MYTKPVTLADIQISRFPKANKPDEVEPSTIGAFIKECRSDRHREVIGRIRSAPTEAERRRIKTEELPVFTPSGLFSRRREADLEIHSGMIIADFDHLRSKGIDPEEMRDRLGKDPHVVMACISPSGDGVKSLVHVQPDHDLHKVHFQQAAEYLKKTYGVEMDQSGKDVCRAFFATHDPDLKSNINATAMPVHGPNGSGPDFRAGEQGMDDSEKPYPWAEPQDIEDYLSPVLPMNREMMPESLAEWVADDAHRVRCPLDFVAVAAAVMTGAVCAARVRIRPGHKGTWEIAPNLWSGVVGPPGSKKTPAISEIFKALSRLEIAAGDHHEENMASHKAALAEHNAELKALNSILNKLRKQRLEGKSKPEDAGKESTLKKQLEDLMKNEPHPPTLRWFRINDPTIEAVQDIMKQDPNCILHERDELTGMLAQWEMDGHQMDRAFFLEAWNGTNPYQGKRIGRGDFRIPLLCLSLFGGIQPVKLIQYLRNPQTSLAHDGAMQRFQTLVYPDSPAKRNHVDQYENTAAKNRFYEVLEKLAYDDFRAYGGKTDEFNKTPWFHFDTPAKTLFEDWLAANEEKAENKNEDPALREHLSKFPKLFCGLSLIFHLIELADTGKSETYIPLRVAQMAEQWCAYLESHARRIYSLVKTPSLFSAMALADKITDPTVKTPLENRFTAYDVFRRQWSGVNTHELVNAALARLEEANWIRCVVPPASKNGGRPTTHYEINPGIIRRRDARGGEK